MKSGVKAINRQKFLTELGKLLTFMYEEDRQLALSMYERMFDAAEDEQALIQGLMSPTRQAVIIARAYDAKVRRLSVSSKSKDEDGYQDDRNETQPFVLAIHRTFEELFPEGGSIQEIAEDQISLFDEERQEEDSEWEETPEQEEADNWEEPFAWEESGQEETEEAEPAEEEPPEEEAEPETSSVDLEDTQEFHLNLTQEEPEEAPADEEEPEEAEPAEEAPEEAEASAEPAEEPQEAQEPREEDPWEALFPVHTPPENVETEETAPAEAEPSAEENAEPAEENAAEQEPPESEREKKQEVPWAREPEEPAPAKEEPVAANRQPAEEAAPEKIALKGQLPDEQQKKFNALFGKPGKKSGKKKSEKAEQPAFEGPVKRVAKVPLLVLYLIVAIPVTLALVILLLVPTAVCLVGSLSMIALGTVLIIAAFSGFAVLADIMLLLGAALVALALGLLLLWMFIWLIGGVIAGLIRAVSALAGEWCYKEVPAE